MKKSIPLLVALVSSLSLAEDCTFDADAADSPGFANKMTKCETLREQADKPVPVKVERETGATLLYGEGTVDPVSGIAERPIVAPGTLNHSPGKVYVAQQPYSLRPNAKFEESVTLAIHHLHSKMAQYCAQGWELEREWTTPVPDQAGDFYLHYRFRCSG